MQPVVFDTPYQFAPPYHGTLWTGLLARVLPWYLRRAWGIESVECWEVHRLAESIAAGHGVLLASNHCRPCDPMVLGMLSREVAQPFYIMASAHLFAGSRLMRGVLRRAGGFSVYREGLDKAAINAAIDILAGARRPLVIFPEGVISRHNDRLNSLMEGTALIARTAAKRRAATDHPGRVVVHPVAIRYSFGGDLDAALEPVLTAIEARLSWRPRRGEPYQERVYRIGRALLSLKEIEYLGEPQSGAIAERLQRVIDRLLEPIEKEWLAGRTNPQGTVIGRVKRLRAALLPDLVKGEVTEEERERRWKQLTALYYAQQMSFYPADYVGPEAPPEHWLETVERFEEDLTDSARTHRPLRAQVTVGPALEVQPARERGAEGDPLMDRLDEQLHTLLGLPPRSPG